MSAPQILVVGESLIDVVHRTDGGVTRTPGGSSFTVAIGTARLAPDARVSFLTDLGADSDGVDLGDRLRMAGVTVLARPRGATSLAHAHLGPDGSAEYDFDLRWDPDPALVPASAWRLLHVGSIGAFLAPGRDAVDALLRATDVTGAIRTFDPNIRPSLLGDHGEVRLRFERTAAASDLVKLSDDDAAWLYPELAADEVLDRLLDAGTALAVLTRGAGGSTLRTRTAQVDVPAPPVPVEDTIGAGDSYLAALIAGIAQRGVDRAGMPRLDHSDLAALGRRAAEVAAIVVGRAGADIPSAAELRD
ncbi:PfkB family carbohydrate kinase [Herbiconiux liukaitaii]|uniref:PfkB family carbohydrate kinase n=1 Tax=Herbiconiux liukaitaii TaxID=3342799 RepID=UPI0035B96365